MVVVARPIVFDEDSPKAMYRHLDRWAARNLATPEAWGSMVERCAQWADYSPRNQVLLASYGIVGPVAGTATWNRVPSTEDGRPCAPRTGEHGLPVRVPVTAEGTTHSQRSRLPARSGTVAAGHRWDLVYAAEQLARRPAPDALRPVTVPSMRPADWNEVVRKAAGRMLGRTPRKVDDPERHLITLAARAPLGPGRATLGDPVLLAQIAWSVADRVGRAGGPMPAFDPSPLSARERWQTLVDVRAATDRVTRAVSHGLGVDLSASVLPRVDTTDDREVGPTRRNYLSPADVRGLPVGVWVESGPYNRQEWLARGVAGAAGRAAHLRVNDRSYLAVYEARSGAMWRLETTGRGAHHGLVADGTADSFDDAKVAVRQALRDRYPDAARAVDADVSAPVGPHHGWVRLPGGRDDRTEGRVYDERVSAMIAPGPGGRWETIVLTDGRPVQGPLTANADDARTVAEALAHGALMTLAAAAPDRANTMIRDLADAGTLTRADLDRLVGARLTDVDRAALIDPATPPERLVDVLTSTGAVGPPAIVAVLHHDHVDGPTVARLVPAIGLPVADAVRELHARWGMDRLDAGAHLSATPDELRAAGCTAVELLQAAPREVLRRLDTREHTWELAGQALLEAGNTPTEAIRQLAAHAPTPETFAAAVHHIDPDLHHAFAVAAREASRPDLVALSERYGLSPAETAQTLTVACANPAVVANVVADRCDGDLEATVAACAAVLTPDMVQRALRDDDVVTALVPAGLGLGLEEADQLDELRAALGDANHADFDTDHGLLIALDAVGAHRDDHSLERDQT